MSTETKKRRKPGRPKKPKGEKLSNAIILRVTDEEKKQIERQIGNQSISDWARERLGLA